MSRRPRHLVLVVAVALVGLTLPLIVRPEVASAAAPPQAWSSDYSVRPYGGLPHTSSPVIADVNGDGQNDIVFGHVDGKIRVLDADGNFEVPWSLPGRGEARFPIPGGGTWPGAGQPPVAIDSSPAVADLDHDGTNEVIVGVGSKWVSGVQPGGLMVFNSDGTYRCGRLNDDVGNIWTDQAGPDGYPEPVFATPAIGDVDGDGYPDIVYGGFDLLIHVIDRNCADVPGFPYDVEDSVWSSPALYDIDGDGRMEIFEGGDQSLLGNVNWAGGELHALDWQGGTVVQMWKQQINDVITSSPAIGDIDGDGRVEVVVGAGNFYGQPDGWHVWAWHADDGTPVPGWPQATGGPVKSSPLIADITGDGQPEVVVGSEDHRVWAWHGNGSLLWKVEPQNCCVPPGPIEASPIAVDVNGDGKQDIVIGNNWGLYVFDGPTGAVTGPLDPGWSFFSSAAVGDFGAKGRRLVATGFSLASGVQRTTAYQLPTSGTPAWPEFRKNARRLGANPSDGPLLPAGFCRKDVNPPSNPSPASGSGYWFLSRAGGVYAFGTPFYGSFGTVGVSSAAAGMAVTPTGNGYWLLADDGGVFSFGAAGFHGSMGGQPLNGPVVNIAATKSGNGYWLLGSDGGVFSFGDAKFFGSTGGMKLNAPVVALAPTPTGNGYWLLGADGGVFSFGDARFFGSTGGLHLNAPVISMTPHPSGGGYWLLAADGGVFSFNVAFRGSVPGTGLCRPPAVRQLRSTATGNGYWLLGADGGVFSFGDAQFFGSAPGLGGANPAVDLAVRP